MLEGDTSIERTGGLIEARTQRKKTARATATAEATSHPCLLAVAMPTATAAIDRTQQLRE